MNYLDLLPDELEEYKDRILNIHENLKTNPNSLQSFMDMEREIFKETNKGKSRKKTEK